MCCNNEFLPIFKSASFKLEKGLKNSDAVKQLQNVLNHLGFKEELQWDKYGADGDYGDLTQKAVALFLKKNNMSGDGSFVDKSIALVLEQKHDTLDELQVLNADITENTIEKEYFYKSKKKTKIQALQTLLNELGYGKTLQWSKYKNDGDYGDLTTKAVALFAKDRGITVDGKILTLPLAKIIVTELSSTYGKHWNLQSLSEIVNDNSNPLVEFSASNFVGVRVIADKDFVPALKRINQYAKDSDVLVLITDSFRFTNNNLTNTVVTPGKLSNHLIGHAIDMNIKYDVNHSKLCNSRDLAKPNLPAPVAKFIAAIRNDTGLRWGGDFSKKDVVHIDDNYNSNIENWKKKYNKIHQS
jgi:peptidoglycan hydrolase-like protein with peptidoglycan-binding domain